MSNVKRRGKSLIFSLPSSRRQEPKTKCWDQQSPQSHPLPTSDPNTRGWKLGECAPPQQGPQAAGVWRKPRHSRAGIGQEASGPRPHSHVGAPSGSVCRRQGPAGKLELQICRSFGVCAPLCAFEIIFPSHVFAGCYSSPGHSPHQAKLHQHILVGDKYWLNPHPGT